MQLRYIWIVLISLHGLIGCSDQNRISITGEVLNPGNVKVVSFYEGDRKLDSVFLSDLSKFKFEREATQPRLLSIAIGKHRYPVILSPGENMGFSVDLQQDPETYSVTGSALSTDLQQFAPIKLRKEAIEDSLQAVFVKSTPGKREDEVENLRAVYLAKYREELTFYTKQAVDFAAQHPSLAGFYAMSTLDPDLAESEIIAYVGQIKDQFLDNAMVTQFKEEAEKLKKLAIGQPAPEFEAYTPNNKAVRLSDYRGKYVLVDFWASWCVPCRKENPHLLHLYKQYGGEAFDVLGVSLDDNPGAWLRAIADDGLVWTNVSDLKAWSSDLIIDYRIKAIPASVVVDPEGNIAAKNLRGEALTAFLADKLN